MPQGKCAFCGTFVTGGGTALGKHSVACTSCTQLALKWLERNNPSAATEAEPDKEKATAE